MTVEARNDGTRQPSDSAEVEGGIEWHRVTLTVSLTDDLHYFKRFEEV